MKGVPCAARSSCAYPSGITYPDFLVRPTAGPSGKWFAPWTTTPDKVRIHSTPIVYMLFGLRVWCDSGMTFRMQWACSLGLSWARAILGFRQNVYARVSKT
jgi:hypothetical protein